MMFQKGVTHIKPIEPVRIDGGPRASDGYDPNPRPMVVSPEQLEKLRSATAAAAAPQPKRKSAGQFETVGISSGDKARIVERYKAGESMTEIAMGYSVSSQRIREIVVSAGVEIRPVGAHRQGVVETPKNELSKPIRSNDDMLTARDVDRMVELHEGGRTTQELAADFGVELHLVEYHIARRGRVAKPALAEPLPEPEPVKSFPPTRDDVTDEMVIEAHRRYMAGDTIEAIEASSPMSWAGLVYRFRGLGLTYPRPRETKTAPVKASPKAAVIDEALLLQVHERYMAGESMDAMYRDGVYPFTPEVMTRRFKKHGLTFPRPRVTDTPDTHPGHEAAAAFLRVNGFSEAEIAAEIAKDPAAKPKRTIPAKRTDVTDEMVRRWTIAHKLYNEPVAAIARESGFSQGLIYGRINSYLLKHPRVIQEAINETAHALGRSGDDVAATPAPPQPQMDDPEPYAAAAQDLARSRARDLHERVIAVQELTPPVFARKQYQPPQVLAFGDLYGVNVGNAMPVARMVGKLVEELNGIPGVKASFDFSYSMHVGA